jgi:hypothetical protein
MAPDRVCQTHVFGHCLAVVPDCAVQTLSIGAMVTATAAPAAGR